MNKVDDYFNAKNAVYNYFGYPSTWPQYPLEDYRTHYWMIVDDYKIVFQENLFTEEGIIFSCNLCNLCSRIIYNDDPVVGYAFYSDIYTLLCVGEGSRHDYCLMILSSNLECKDEKFKEIYKEYW